MNRRSKIAILGVIAVITVFSGCKKEKEIVVSENVKESVVAKAEDNKPKNKPELKRTLRGLEGQDILFWIDNNNLLTSEEKDGKVILYSYNLDSEKSTELLNQDNITHIFGTDSDGVALVGNKKLLFEFDVKTKKLEEILDFDKEFKNGIPGARVKWEQGFIPQGLGCIKLIKRGYITYVTKINHHGKDVGTTAEYTILDYKNNKRNTIEARYSAAGIGGKFDLMGKNIYIEELRNLHKLNIETGEISSMPIPKPLSLFNIIHVFEDGKIFVECQEEIDSPYGSMRFYKVDFDNKELIKYEGKYDGTNLSIDSIDFKNQFFTFTRYINGDDEGKNTIMYGTIEDSKFIVKGKLIEHDKIKEKDCITFNRFVFSPDHNKFITAINVEKYDESINKKNIMKDDKYLFELK